MNTIYLNKTLHYKSGVTLKCQTGYQAVWDDEFQRWVVNLHGGAVIVSVLPKYVEKAVKLELELELELELV
jgi:hypothetical protein